MMSKVLVDNQLYISNPTDDMYKWCRNNLILDNPDYIKKLKMNKWLGGTPEYIYLYQQIGNTLVIPFGCLQRFHQFFSEQTEYQLGFTEKKSASYQSKINLYDYQERAVKSALRLKNGILVMPCGSGKTQTAIEIISRIGGTALWLTHTQDLLNQSKIRAESVLDTDCTFGTITSGKVNIGTGITFATVQTMSKLNLSEYKHYWDVIVVDECMPENTLIDTPTGQKELKNLCIDDIITSYNEQTKKVENKRVTHIFKSKAHDIVKVKLKNGEEIVCTSNHPIFTKDRQWIDAERLGSNDYVLRLVWERSRYGQNAINNKVPNIKEGLLLLLQRMFCNGRSQKGCLDGRAQGENVCKNERNKRKISRSVRGTHENEQSNEKSGSKKSGIRQAERNRTQASDKVRKRSRIDSSATKFCTQISRLRRCLYGISNSDKNVTRKRLSDLLQSRYRNSRKDDCDRNRRKFSLRNRKAGTGFKKRAIFEWVRVDSVEVQKQTSDGTFGGVCCDGYVYNIEVEDNNNYFANGILVHNCQHCCGSPTRVTQFYKVISALSARYKFGLTATPRRADGLHESMFALLGGVIHEVSRKEVEQNTCPIQVIPAETGYRPDYDNVLMSDGTLDYNALTDDLVNNKDRFQKVLDCINTIGKSILVLGSRVQYIQNLHEKFNGKSVCLSTLGQSKKAKAERKETLRKLNEGELDAVFSTYQLAKEGLDVPNLQYVIFATPVKDEITVIQSAGRVGRKADGKTIGTVIDFVDDFSLYRRYFSKRKSCYKKIEAKVIDID